MAKNIRKKLSGKCSPDMLAHLGKFSECAHQKLLHHAK